MDGAEHAREDAIAAYRARVRAGLPSREVQWRILLELLSREGTTEEVTPGRIVVHADKKPPTGSQGELQADHPWRYFRPG